MLVRVSRPKSAASGVLQRGHYPHPHSRHAGSSGRYPEPSVRQFSDTAGGGGGGGRHTPDVWRGQLGCTDTQQQLHCTTGRQIGGIGTPAPGTCGQCATLEHRSTSDPHYYSWKRRFAKISKSQRRHLLGPFILIIKTLLNR